MISPESVLRLGSGGQFLGCPWAQPGQDKACQEGDSLVSPVSQRGVPLGVQGVLAQSPVTGAQLLPRWQANTCSQ